MAYERGGMLRELAQRIAAVPARPTRVAIDGPDAAGKTVLASELARSIESTGRPIVRASIDGFHRPAAERYARGSDSPEGYFLDSFDYPSLRRVLLEPLGLHGELRYRSAIFDYRTDAPVVSPVRTADRDAVLLFDGVFLLRPELFDCWNFRIFVFAPFQEVLRRALVRDVGLLGSPREVERRYAGRYIPGQRLYYSVAKPWLTADVVVDNGDIAAPRLLDRRERADFVPY